MLRQLYILQIYHLESTVSVLNLVTLSLLGDSKGRQVRGPGESRALKESLRPRQTIYGPVQNFCALIPLSIHQLMAQKGNPGPWGVYRAQAKRPDGPSPGFLFNH